MAIDGGLRALFRKHLPAFHWVSIESRMTGSGIPDANYCVGGIEGWVEFKLTSGWTVGLAPEQIGWHAQRNRAGGRTFIAVRRQRPAGKRTDATDELWLFRGADARALKSEGLKSDNAHLACYCYRGPEQWDWGTVRRLLSEQNFIKGA
jgi:hypothetical protein